MVTEVDAVTDLARRIGALEILVSNEVLKVKSGTDPFLNISSCFDRLQTALEQQQQAFQDFVRAHSVHHSNNLVQYISSGPTIAAPAIKVSSKGNKDAATQTPLAQSPPVPLPPPPPVRVRPPEHLPKGPSPLRRSISTETGQHQAVAYGKDGSIPQNSSFRGKNASGLAIPRSPGTAHQQSPGSTTSNQGIRKTFAGSDAGLRERRAAFAALQSSVPQDKAAKRTSLTITAAQRELVRAAAKSKEEANREREEHGGVLAWIGFVLIVIGGIGSVFLGILAMTMRAERVAAI